MKKTVLTALVVAAFGLQAMAQGSNFWAPVSSGFTAQSRGIRDIDITSPTNAWAISYDGTTASVQTQDFTRTTDGGLTWTAGTIPNIPTWEFSNISAIDANTAWVALFNSPTPTSSLGGRVYKTTDGGATWTQQATTAFANSNSFLNIVHMFDANNGWMQGDPINGEFEMYTTSNGGTTWTAVPGANIPNPLSGEYGTVDVYTTVGNNIIYFGTNKGRVFKSTDAGLNWTLAGPTTLTIIEDLAFSDANNGLATQGDDLMRTTDGGATWTPVLYTGKIYGNDLKFVPGTTNTFVSTGAGDATLGLSGSSFSSNGGVTWIDYDAGFQRTALDFFSPTVGFAGGFSSATTGLFKFTGTVAMGINNSEFSKAVTVFPNPSAGKFTIDMPATAEKSAEITVADALGRVVYAKNEKLNGAYNGSLDLSNLGKGVYVLNIKTGANISMRKLVIE